MIKIFIDEKIEERSEVVRFYVCSTVFENLSSTQLKQSYRAIVQLSKPKQTDRLLRFLDDIKGWSELTYADVPRRLVPTGGLDSTLDIPRMARRNNLWSANVMFNLGGMCGALCKMQTPMSAVEVFFDPYSLGKTLDRALQEFVKQRIPKIANEILYPVKFTSIAQVPKQPNLNIASDGQVGISISDRILKQTDEILNMTSLKRINISNISNDVRVYIEQYNAT